MARNREEKYTLDSVFLIDWLEWMWGASGKLGALGLGPMNHGSTRTCLPWLSIN